MLTILAWMIFVPAFLWNIVFFTMMFADLLTTFPQYINRRTLRDACLSLAILFISGTYLFGIF